MIKELFKEAKEEIDSTYFLESIRKGVSVLKKIVSQTDELLSGIKAPPETAERSWRLEAELDSGVFTFKLMESP
jgi:hypothetical protein